MNCSTSLGTFLYYDGCNGLTTIFVDNSVIVLTFAVPTTEEILEKFLYDLKMSLTVEAPVSKNMNFLKQNCRQSQRILVNNSEMKCPSAHNIYFSIFA